MCETVTTLAKTVEALAQSQLTKSGKAKPKQISTRLLWRLVALCHGTKPDDIPIVWNEMLEADTWEEALDVLVDAIVDEAESTNLPIQVPRYFVGQIKKLLTGQFVPRECLLYENRNDAVISFLDCLPKGEGDVMKLRKHDRTMVSTPRDSLNYDLLQQIEALEKGQKQPTACAETFRETFVDM